MLAWLSPHHWPLYQRNVGRRWRTRVQSASLRLASRGCSWRALLVMLALVISAGPAAALDEIVLSNGKRYLGTIVSTTADMVVLSIENGTVSFPRAMVVSPSWVALPASTAATTAGRNGEADSGRGATTAPAEIVTAPHSLPGVAEALRRLRPFPWGKSARQVPMFVAYEGRWQFMPAVSFWIGDFFQLAFYGDPARPAAIEASLHRPSETDWNEKRKVLEYVIGLVPGLALDARFDRLNVHGDSFAISDLWFELTGPDSVKTPGRWAVLLLHEPSVALSRASYDELDLISEPVAAATIDPRQPRSWQRGSWTPEDIAWLRNIPTSIELSAGENAPQAANAERLRPMQAALLRGERVFVRSFVRERGRYARSANDWLREVASTLGP